MREDMRKFAQSLEAARSGIAVCLRSERNFRFHLAAAFYALVLSVVGRVGRLELLAVLLCIALVIGSEMINTAIEMICDSKGENGYSVMIKCIKDISAGAVLVFAVIAAAAGIIIFVRKEVVNHILAFAEENPFGAAAIAATLLPASLFIRRKRKK